MPKVLYEEYEEIIHSGFLYVHGLDVYYRPIIVANAKKFVELNAKHPIEHFICAIEVFMLNLNNMLIKTTKFNNIIYLQHFECSSCFCSCSVNFIVPFSFFFGFFSSSSTGIVPPFF